MLCSIAGQAQQPKVLAPHKPVAPRIEKPIGPPPTPKLQTSVGGFWMTSAYFKSALYLKNGLKTGPLTVTPALYLSNGVRLPLAPVTMEPSGTAVVNINQALADQGLTFYVSLNGYVEITFQWAWDAVCATVRNVDTVHSLIFISNLQPLPPPNPAVQPAASTPPTQNLEGLWWKEESNVTGFVALSNVTGSPIDAAIQVLDDQNNNLGNHSVTVSPHGTKIVNLNELLSATTPRGGVTMSYTGSPDALLVSAELEDETVGYSAHLPIGPLPKAANQVSESSFAELGLMTGEQDSMMNFPRGTVFKPYSVVRNSSDQPLSVTPALWWMQGGSAHSSPLPPFAVPSHRTQTLDISSYLTTAGLQNYNGDVNLVLDTKGQSGGLLAAGGSLDQTKTYVFEVMPRGFTESVSTSFAYWSTANGDDTMVTIWNPADEQQDYLFTLYYAGGQNSFPIYLGPRESRSFNVSEFTMGIHVAEGNLVPMEAQSGSAEISGAQDENEHILIAADAAVYNVIKATCGIVCTSCNGFTTAQLVIDGFSVPVGNATQESLSVTYNGGTQYNRTGSSTWSSSNTSAATVTSGLVRGVSAGTTNVVAIDNYQQPVYINMICTPPPAPTCPISYGYPGGGAGGSVTPTVLFIGGNNFIFEGTDPTVTSFNGQQVQGTPSQGTFGWSATSTSSYNPQVLFNGSPSTYSTSSGSVTATVIGALSSSLLDTTLSVSYSVNNQSAQTPAAKAITIRQFEYLVQSGSIQNIFYNGPTQYGFVSNIYYNVYTHPAGQILAPGFGGISVYEEVNLGLCNFPGANLNTGTGALFGTSQLVDSLSLRSAQSLPPSLTCAADQYLGVGGFIVRHNTVNWSSSGPAITNLGPTN